MEDFNIDALIEKRQRELNEIIKDIKDGKLTLPEPIPRKEPKEITKITDITSGEYVRVIGKIEEMRGPFEFRRQDGNSGRVVFIDLLINISDKVELVLWNDDCRISEQLAENDKIEVDGLAKEYKGKPQVHIESLTLHKELL